MLSYWKSKVGNNVVNEIQTFDVLGVYARMFYNLKFIQYNITYNWEQSVLFLAFTKVATHVYGIE